MTLWYSGVLGCTLLLFGVFIYFFMNKMLISEVDASIAGRARTVVKSITVVGPFPFPLQQIVLPDIDVFATPNTYLQVIDYEGRVRSRSKNLGLQTFPLGESTIQKASRGSAFYETVNAEEQKIRIYNLPLLFQGKFIGVLQVGQSLVNVDMALSRLRFILFIGSGLTIILAGTLGWLLARTALLPINKVTQTASAIQEAQDLNRRIEYQGPPDELGRLINTINDMLDRLNTAYQKLEQSYHSQRRFVADASHELRTPLTIIRGNVDLLQQMGDAEPDIQREALADISDEAKRMSLLVNDLLALARADAGQKLDKHPVSLRELVEDVVHRAQKLAGEVNFKIEDLAPLGNLYTLGNEEYLRRLFLILLDNAFKYTPAGGLVTVKPEINESFAGAAIIDTGSGIALKNIKHIFDRFYREDPARGSKGVGLGLSIAKWIAEEHHGTIEVDSSPGKGSIFTVCLPLLDKNE